MRDEDGASSKYVTLYNVQAVPEFFLIDKSNTLVNRSAQIKDVEAAIAALL